MHRILEKHLESFCESLGYQSLSRDTQFEYFCAQCLMQNRALVGFDLDAVVTSGADDGMDGVAIVVNEELIVSPEDAGEVFSTSRKNNEVDLIFIQAKSGESIDLGEFLKFKESILRFIENKEYEVLDDVQSNAREVFNSCVDNVSKVKNGKPNAIVRFAYAGLYQEQKPWKEACELFKQELLKTGFIHNVEIAIVDRDDLVRYWVDSMSPIQAILPFFSSAALPTIAGIEEAYLVVAKAVDVVRNLLSASDGTLRSQVFEENVRSYLGNDNFVNKSIADTLSRKESASRFPVLNNGITVVSHDVRIQSNSIHLENFQIVNGCQTSNVLFENLAHLDESVMVNIKVIETNNEDVFSELVRATNSQTKVEENQFISLLPIVKKIEAYFSTYDEKEGKIYFERRERQYAGLEVPALRIFSLNSLIRCVAAMFLERPHQAFRYPKEIYDSFSSVIFKEGNKEIIFYTACLTMYRFYLLTSNGLIPQGMRRYKWHILVLVRHLIAGAELPPLNSKKIDPLCKKIIDVVSKHGTPATSVFTRAVAAINLLGEISDDRLKRQNIVQEMIAALPKTK